MLIEIFKKHNKDIATLIEKGSTEFAPATLGKYETASKHTRDFLKWNYNVVDYVIT